MQKQTIWQQHWLLEAVRLKESQWGPIEDAVEVRKAIAAGGRFHERLLLRAQLLGQRAGWPALQLRMLRALRLSLVALSVLFILLGIGAALGALTDVDGRVNILLALVALLAVPSASLLFWVLAFFFSSSNSGFGLSQLWLWLSQRIVKGPDQGLLFNALFSFSGRQSNLRWGFSVVNHWLWLLALVSATCTVLALLAAKRYHFNWETTLLSADSFVALVQGLGVLPSYLGFVTPAEAVIRQSDGLQLVPAGAQVQWSSWLVGCLVVYGVLPRIAVLVLSLLIFKQRQRRLHIDTNQIGFIELRQRLQPRTESVGVDAVAGADQVPEAKVVEQRPAMTATTVVIGVELPPDHTWPPALLPSAWLDAGIVDSREQRAELLARLSQERFEHVVLCADSRQTPDRGVVAWLAELASYGVYCTVYLMNTNTNASASEKGLQSPSGTDLLEAWFSRLNQAGFKAVYTDFEQLFTNINTNTTINN